MDHKQIQLNNQPIKGITLFAFFLLNTYYLTFYDKKDCVEHFENIFLTWKCSLELQFKWYFGTDKSRFIDLLNFGTVQLGFDPLYPPPWGIFILKRRETKG